MKKRVLITTGGTGGHIFPAQGLADQLSLRMPEVEVLFIGGGLSTNRYFEKESYPYREVACSSFHTPLKLYKIIQGGYQSSRIISEFQPDLIVGFGSYNTFPALLAAKTMGVPIILHEANSIPGKVNRWMARYSKAIGVHFPQTIPLINGNAIEVGMPLRKAYTKGRIIPAEARRYFNLSADTPTLLVFGGSQGAAAINALILKAPIPKNLQVIHLTGDPSIVEAITCHYSKNGVNACVKVFEKEMFRAWAAADFFISRAGASTIAEAMEFEIPGILIPYPLAAENHQEINADFFTSQVGGGVKFIENKENEALFFGLIENFADPVDRLAMMESIREYKLRGSSMDLFELVRKYLG
jgi:UDP-N-acetylglucosamine--N-acetylmuramyl-(pentapeptide) pyrophosphoryl-undecaprenol N-acetylglucosamine transferase